MANDAVTKLRAARSLGYAKPKPNVIAIRLKPDSRLLASANRLFLTSYSADSVCDALPIVPFTFSNERVQGFENLLFAEFRDEIFQILLNFSSYRHSQFWRRIDFFPASPVSGNF
jgi:hypothetical protein